jgi:hypothetical protein
VVTKEWGKLHSEEFNDLNSSPNIDRVIKSRMSLTEHVARVGEKEVCTGIWWRKLRERNYLGDAGVDERIILRWIFRKWDVGVWSGSSCFRIGTGGG